MYICIHIRGTPDLRPVAAASKGFQYYSPKAKRTTGMVEGVCRLVLPRLGCISWGLFLDILLGIFPPDPRDPKILDFYFLWLF